MTTTHQSPAGNVDGTVSILPIAPPADGDRSTPSRRQVLVAAGVGAGALTLAACGSSSTAAPSSTAAAAVVPTSTPAAAAGGSAATGATLVALDKVPVGGAVAATDAAGKPIIIARPTAGSAVAFSAICTHMGCPVKISGADLNCPCHGSKYNALTGAVLKGPAPKALATVAVKVTDGNVVAG